MSVFDEPLSFARPTGKVCLWEKQTFPPSEVCLCGLWDRKEALTEVILVVLGTDHFVERHFRLALGAPVTLSRIPGHRERAYILDVNLDFHFIAAFDECKALDDVE